MSTIAPPPLPWKVRTRGERLILVAFAACVLVGGLLFTAHFCGAPLSLCAWKHTTGLPCAGCGGTRAVSLLLAGHAVSAFTLNPGAVGGALLFAALAVYAALVLLFRIEPLRFPFLRSKACRIAVIGAIAANWVYLLLAGRA